MEGVSHAPVPHLLHIETTYACNSRCVFCYNPRREERVAPDRLGLLASAVLRARVPHVYLIGGEPSLLGVEVLNGLIESLATRSSVTVVTNGLKYLPGLSTRLACVGVPIHGSRRTHEALVGVPGAYDRVLASVRGYVAGGHDVRCIPVLNQLNCGEMEHITQVAAELGMESVFVDRFEDGGLGSARAQELKLTPEGFARAIDGMIAGRDRWGVPVGFGTAVPFCADPRLARENLEAACGAGFTFAALTPQGDLRICNQSERAYGNVLQEGLLSVWNSPELEDFRDLRWVGGPCSQCPAWPECLGGCKVDASSGVPYTVDYAVRGLALPPHPVARTKREGPPAWPVPRGERRFRVNRYARLNDSHCPAYLVTRYQTVELDVETALVVREILSHPVFDEAEMVGLFKEYTPLEVRSLLSGLSGAGAVDTL